MVEKAAMAALLWLLLCAGRAGSQDFQYHFQDRPTPEADVVVVNHRFRRGPGADLYIVGRVFNRGLKPAQNVRVNLTVRDRYGAQYPINPIRLSPADIPPTSYAGFEERITLSIDPRDVFVTARAEWDP